MPKATDTTKGDAADTTAANDPWRGAGFTKENKPYPGVHPDTGERKAVTYEGLQKEFGPKRGADLYMEIARVGGFGYVEGNPALSLVGMDDEHAARVKKVLAEAEKRDVEKE